MTKVASTVVLMVIARVEEKASLMVEMTDEKKVNEKGLGLVRKWDQDSAQKMGFTGITRN